MGGKSSQNTGFEPTSASSIRSDTRSRKGNV